MTQAILATGGIPIAKYYALVGSKVIYLDNKGETSEGILREIHREGGFYYASVQNLKPRVLTPKVDEVPIANVFKMNFTSPMQQKSSTGNGNHRRVHWAHKIHEEEEQSSSNSKARVNMEDFPLEFRYGQVTYDKVDHIYFKVGQEVVWMNVEEDEGRGKDRPLVGVIQKIGRNRHKPSEFVAVVHFDERTNHLPKYIQLKPRNRNIVKLEELKDLGEWLEENTLVDNTFTQENNVIEAEIDWQKETEEDLISFPKEVSTNPFLYELEQSLKS